MKKYIFTLFCFLFVIFTQIFAQIPAGYYNNANGKKGKNLQIALNQIIKNHRSVTYGEVWIYYQYTDTKPSGKIWDIYSDNPQGTPAYEFDYRTGQCINIGSEEGKCYTREHSFCQSWFGGSGNAVPRTDMFHIYPTDGWINTKRNDNPYGVVNTPTLTTTNGSKMGLNTYPNAPVRTCFEPVHDFKGDIARSFFYMATRYMFEDNEFLAETPMTFKSQLKPWVVDMFLEWHHADPVSQKERDRNNAIYAVQKNRNPFIDHPEWVAQIWGSDSINPVVVTIETPPEKPRIKWFALTDNRTLKMTFTQPMVAWTVENPLNYYIYTNIMLPPTVAPTVLHYQNDTLIMRLGGLFAQNTLYNLSVQHLLSSNMAFLDDDVVSFTYTYPVEQKPLLAWTFDNLKGKPNTPRKIAADYYLSDSLSEAVLYCDGTYQSSVWLSGSELDAFSGTISGDPRPNPVAGKDFALVSETANRKSIVFKFPTKGYYNLTLSMAARKTASGFNSHEWEWSLDGKNYTFIEYTHTCPLTDGGNHTLTTLDLKDIDELNNKDSVFLRLKFDGANGSSGNNRLDNITLHGVPVHDNAIHESKKKDNGFFIIPNPNQGLFQIRPDEPARFSNTDFVIYNFMGQAIKTGKLDTSWIDISEQTNGVYFIKIAGECLKVIKY